jgi:hypothetical protein
MAILTEKDKKEMAERADVRRKLYQDQARETIQAQQIVKVLQDHVLGKGRAKITAAKLKAAEILLDKSLPSLSSIKADVEAKHAVFNMTTVFTKPTK